MDTPPCPATLIGADWSKEASKRAVYQADIPRRRVRKIANKSWTLDCLLAVANDQQRINSGAVVIAVDLALGVPAKFLNVAKKIPRWKNVASFLDLLATIEQDDPEFWKEVKQGKDWSPNSPFASVPPGKGSLTAYYEKAGFDFHREIDKRCQAKPPFIVSGIPGSVGSGTRSFWQELTPHLRAKNRLKIWPFDGSMRQLLSHNHIIVAEAYPGISYSSALANALPSQRIIISKTKRDVRKAALTQLESADWVSNFGVSLNDTAPAIDSEDDFDALMIAAGGLRALLENQPMDCPPLNDRLAEGGILFSGMIDFNLKGKRIKPAVD